MNKLSALDAGFLYNESERSPQHVASVQILELPAGTEPDDFLAQLKSLLAERIHLVSYFTNKLQFVPFNLDHPVWVKDRDFDIDNHVLQAEIPAPGGRAELEATIAEIHSQLLDRSRPLWDLWVLTGLQGGRVAYYNRAHHACIDGMAGQAMLETIMDVSAEPRRVDPAPTGFLDHGARTAAELIAGAFENFTRFQVKQASSWMNHIETATRLYQRTLDPSKGLGAVAQAAPKTRFNNAVERKRSFATGELPLTPVKAMAKATGTKVNDVFLAVCAGALRRYLERSGELPGDSLIAGCPVSLRQPGDTAANNQVTMMMVDLATAESDPLRRLLEIGRSATLAKHFTADVAGSYDSDASLPGLPAMLRAGARVLEATNLAGSARPPCNVVVSNVPGPNFQLYSNGARMLTHYPVSIPAHTQAVNITVQSYLGELFFSITACARALPDAGLLRDDMLAAYEELQTAMAPAAAPQQEVSEIADARPQAAPRVAVEPQVEPDIRAA